VILGFEVKRVDSFLANDNVRNNESALEKMLE